MIRFLFLFTTVVWSTLANAEDAMLSKLFADKGVDGTIVISSLNSGQTFIHNDSRSKQPFSPASTFKVINTLIAVEENVISGKDDVFKWDGHVYDVSQWNQDQTLETAFKVSCVWCYQRLATRIGADNYRHYLQQTAYGALNSDFDITQFWLDGSLTISAMEQIGFLKDVFHKRLSFNNKAYETLQQIMLVEQTPNYSLWAKTGWAARSQPSVGWYVGYVKTDNDVWFFALNMTIHSQSDLPLRQQLVRLALQAKTIID